MFGNNNLSLIHCIESHSVRFSIIYQYLFCRNSITFVLFKMSGLIWNNLRNKFFVWYIGDWFYFIFDKVLNWHFHAPSKMLLLFIYSIHIDIFRNVFLSEEPFKEKNKPSLANRQQEAERKSGEFEAEVMQLMEDLVDWDRVKHMLPNTLMILPKTTIQFTHFDQFIWSNSGKWLHICCEHSKYVISSTANSKTTTTTVQRKNAFQRQTRCPSNRCPIRKSLLGVGPIFWYINRSLAKYHSSLYETKFHRHEKWVSVVVVCRNLCKRRFFSMSAVRGVSAALSDSFSFETFWNVRRLKRKLSAILYLCIYLFFAFLTNKMWTRCSLFFFFATPHDAIGLSSPLTTVR